MAEKVAKVTISLPADLLDDIDGCAAEIGESRSLVIREASLQYLKCRRDAEAARARRCGVEQAMRIMQEIRGMLPLDNRSGTELLRELRDHDGLVAPATFGEADDGGRDG